MNIVISERLISNHTSRLKAKAFSLSACQQNSASFIALDHAQFIDNTDNEITDMYHSQSDMVQSIESCHLDLQNQGERFEGNNNWPYFEGHDRPDVMVYIVINSVIIF